MQAIVLNEVEQQQLHTQLEGAAPSLEMLPQSIKNYKDWEQNKDFLMRPLIDRTDNLLAELK